jgi:hypothetical protein
MNMLHQPVSMPMRIEVAMKEISSVVIIFLKAFITATARLCGLRPWPGPPRAPTQTESCTRCSAGLRWLIQLAGHTRKELGWIGWVYYFNEVRPSSKRKQGAACKASPRASSRSLSQGGARWEEATRGGYSESSDGDVVWCFNSDSSRLHPRRARRSSKPGTVTISQRIRFTAPT